jgi:hypothetical protein
MRDIENNNHLFRLINSIKDAPLADAESAQVREISLESFYVAALPWVDAKLQETAVKPTLKRCIRPIVNRLASSAMIKRYIGTCALAGRE